MADKTYTDDEIAQMRAAITEIDRKNAEAAQAKRAEYMKPLVDLLTGDCFRTTLAMLKDIAANYSDDGTLSIHVNALVQIMPNLMQAAGVPLIDPMAVEAKAE